MKPGVSSLNVAKRSVRQGLFVALALVFVRVLFLQTGLGALPPDHAGSGLGNDASRYHQIASETGRPYRDFEVEFPPLTLAAIELLHGETSRDTAERLGWSQLALDLLIAFMVFLGWGMNAGLTYLVIGTSMSFFLYFRIDLLSVALAVAGLLLVRRRAEATGGFLLAAGVFAKLWPILLIPLLAAERKWKAVVWSSLGTLVGGLAWGWWSGWKGPGQVLTFRGARGWEVESLVGSVLWGGLRRPARIEAGAVRVGEVDPVVRVLLPIAALVVVAIVSIWVRRTGERTEGGPAVAGVGALLLSSTVLSHQYLSWLLPWAVISGRGSLQILVFLAGASALGVIITGSVGGTAASWAQLAFLFARNAFLVAVTVLSLLSVRARVGPREQATQ